MVEIKGFESISAHHRLPVRATHKSLMELRLSLIHIFVVFKGSYLIDSVGYLILRPASRLDAFS